MTTEVSFVILESSIMLLDNIYSTGVTYDDRHLLSSYFLVQATVDSRGVIYAAGEHL
jgi:hypothetical protein